MKWLLMVILLCAYGLVLSKYIDYTEYYMKYIHEIKKIDNTKNKQFWVAFYLIIFTTVVVTIVCTKVIDLL